MKRFFVMTPKLFEDIRINAQKIVSNSVSEYERVYGRFKIDAIKQKFLDNARELFLGVVERIYNKEEVSLLPLRGIISKLLSDLDFDSKTLVAIYSVINQKLLEFIKKEPNFDANINRAFSSYLKLIEENIGDYSFYSALSVTNVIQNQPEYQYSDEFTSFTPKEIIDSRVYTLFPRSRDWESFSKIGPAQAYSPLSYNRIAVSSGYPQYKIKVSYEDLVIFENELYKLRPDVPEPTRDRFIKEEWTKYSSKNLDKNKTFNAIHLEKIRSAFGRFTEEGFAINEVISDSSVSRYETPIQIDKDLLPSTFAGVGKQIYQITEQLEQITDQFGGYEGSVVGGFEYLAQFTEYLLSSSFGRRVSEVFDITPGESWFGRFNLIFSAKTSENKIPGLKFLNGFSKLRSFAHRQQITELDAQSKTKVIYNPIYSQFSNGILDRYISLTPESGYAEKSRVDLLLYAIQSTYRKCSSLGDLVKAGLNSLDEGGRVPGYEGLGSVEVQLMRLQSVFPPSSVFFDLSAEDKIGPGLTGAFLYMLKSYSRFTQGVINPALPGQSMEFLSSWVQRISNKIEELLKSFQNIGLGESNYVPNISFKGFKYENTQLIGFFKRLGFRDSEINQIVSVESFAELIGRFAPLSDSSDLKSFFKAYELTQLIYEFGGEEGIDAYLDFLYSTNSLDSLLNILSLAQKNKSKITHIKLSRYPKLVGLLIGLTYAIDPGQLIKFNKILGQNNLTLLESITFLYQKGESTIIKDRDDIDVLKPMIDQMIRGVYLEDGKSSPAINYEQVNSLAPIALRQWTKLLESNLGKLDSVSVIEDLYDKAIGLTPKELISLLNLSDSPTPLSELVDGFNGGDFSSFLRYANISGLGIKLGFYKNSYQTDNFKIQDSGEFSVIPNIISTMSGIVDSMSIFETVLNAVLDYTFTNDQQLDDILTPIIFAQNKVFDTFPSLIEQQANGSPLGQRELFAANANILESPGKGNSRLPNRVPVLNSITPEQFEVLSQSSSGAQIAQLSTSIQQSSLIRNFIKFTESNTLANEISTNETENLGLSTGGLDSASEVNRPDSKAYVVPKIYVDMDGGNGVESNREIVSSGLGTNYIKYSTSSVIPTFDPISSCKRFGGNNCEEIYETSQDRCVNPGNKSLFPETTQTIPGVSKTSIVIDRPLGSFAKYVPRNVFLPTSSFKSPPAYYKNLPESTIPGEKGEPMLSTVLANPLVFDTGSGELTEYGDTEFAIVEFIRAKLEKNSEFSCAGYESPYLYQICMNVMKCKRFKPSDYDREFLDFCPNTLSGGRLKK